MKGPLDSIVACLASVVGVKHNVVKCKKRIRTTVLCQKHKDSGSELALLFTTKKRRTFPVSLCYFPHLQITSILDPGAGPWGPQSTSYRGTQKVHKTSKMLNYTVGNTCI